MHSYRMIQDAVPFFNEQERYLNQEGCINILCSVFVLWDRRVQDSRRIVFFAPKEPTDGGGNICVIKRG